MFFLFRGRGPGAGSCARRAGEKITDEVIGIIKQDKNIRAGNQKKINEVVDAKVLPYFNFSRMTALAVGRILGTQGEERLCV